MNHLCKILHNIPKNNSFVFENNLYYINVSPNINDKYLISVNYNNKKIINIEETEYHIHTTNLIKVEDPNPINNELIMEKKWSKNFGENNLSKNCGLFSLEESAEILEFLLKLSKVHVFS